MKFKVVKGSVLFNKLDMLGEQIKEVKNLARKVARDLGFDNAYVRNFVLAGGLSGLCIADGRYKPDGYKWVFKGAVWPTKANKEALLRLENLPVLTYDDLNKLVGYSEEMSERPGQGSGTVINWCPVVIFRDEYILLNVPVYSGKYKPVKGMVEILESEYNALKEQK